MEIRYFLSYVKSIAMLKDFSINYRRIILATDPGPRCSFQRSLGAIQLSLVVHAIIILETSKFKRKKASGILMKLRCRMPLRLCRMKDFTT